MQEKKESEIEKGKKTLYRMDINYVRSVGQSAVPVYYIGEFKDGCKEGYGIEYKVDLGGGKICLKYEGEFKEGKYESEGVSYLGSIADSIDKEYATKRFFLFSEERRTEFTGMQETPSVHATVSIRNPLM